MSFPAYPHMKESGVQWLGDVPQHWEILQLKRVTTSYCDGPFGSGLKSEHYTDEGVRVVRLQNIRTGAFDASDEAYIDRAYFDREHSGHSVLAGDVLIAGLGDERNVVGRACVAPADIEPAMVKADCFRFRLDRHQAEPGFIAQYLSAAAPYDAGKMASGSTRLRIPLLVTASRTVALPPLAEQQDISTFLDRETAKIDALVEAQRELIELLKEKRQAVISHAVTKGLDPAAPTQDSGVEWLGEMPVHWEICALRTLFRFVKRQNRDDLEVLSVYRDYGVIKKASRDDNNNKTPEDLSSYQTVRPGDLVVNKMKAWQGSLGVSSLLGITSPDYAVFEPIQNAHPKYLHALLRCQLLPSVYRTISNGIRPAQWRLEPDRLKELRVPLPPPAEQERIAAAIADDAIEYDALASEAERAIALLQERRAALISAAVTGKIDVRGLAAAPKRLEAAA